jgi:hypothetical protein
VGGFAIFSYGPTGQEVSVPVSPEFATTIKLAFDNTNGYVYGVALVDSETFVYDGQPNDVVTASIKDESGIELGTKTFSISPRGHTTFILSDQFPQTKNRLGTVSFAISGFGTLAGLGLRGSPRGALTSVDMFEPTTY